MVGKVKARRLSRPDWEIVIRQYEAGRHIADIAAATGLSESWVRHKIWRHSKEDFATRNRHHMEALRRELIRAEADLMKGGVDKAVKQMRALNMLVKLEKELQRVSRPELMPAPEAEDIADVRAEIERRFDRLRAARDTKQLPVTDDGKRASRPDP
jgi:DNA-binding Lrp family transcriptional regulator